MRTLPCDQEVVGVLDAVGARMPARCDAALSSVSNWSSAWRCADGISPCGRNSITTTMMTPYTELVLGNADVGARDAVERVADRVQPLEVEVREQRRPTQTPHTFPMPPRITMQRMKIEMLR